MLNYIMRFLIGGTIVTAVPLVAQHLGSRLAGMVVLIPATSLLSAYFIGRDQGSHAVAVMAGGGLIGLLALAVFFVALEITAPYGLAIGLTVSFATWAAGVWLLKGDFIDWRVIAAAVAGMIGLKKIVRKPLRSPQK